MLTDIDDRLSGTLPCKIANTQSDGLGTAQMLKTVDGKLQVDIISGGGGGGDATALNQSSMITELQSIDSGKATGTKQDDIITKLTNIDTDQATASNQTTINTSIINLQGTPAKTLSDVESGLSTVNGSVISGNGLITIANDYILNGMSGIPNKNRSGKCYIATTGFVLLPNVSGSVNCFGLYNNGTTTMYVYNIQAMMSNFSSNTQYNVTINTFSNATNPFGGGASVTPVNLNRGSSNTSSVIGIKYDSGAYTNSATTTLLDNSVLSLYGTRLRSDFLEDMIILPPDNGIEIEMGTSLSSQYFVGTIRWYEE